MKSDLWFARVREEIEYVGLSAQLLGAMVPTACLGLDFLSFGYRLRLINASLAIEIEMIRRASGIELTAAEDVIALALQTQTREVEDLLAQHEATGDGEIVIEQLWLLVCLKVILSSWRQFSFPENRINSLLAVWGNEDFLGLGHVHPRGLDRLFFGHRARARYFAEVEERISSEHARLTC